MDLQLRRGRLRRRRSGRDPTLIYSNEPPWCGRCADERPTNRSPAARRWATCWPELRSSPCDCGQFLNKLKRMNETVKVVS
jgi:hypothetical protein